MNKAIEFAKHLGKVVLHKNKEYILHGVTSGYIFCINGKPDPVSLPYHETKLVFNSQDEFKESETPTSISVVKNGDEYTDALEETDIDRENQLLAVACRCARIDMDELYGMAKNRKMELVEVRQLHMAIRQRLTRNESLTQTGIIYGKDHATVIHAIKKIDNSLDGYNLELREKYRPVFELMKKLFKHKAEINFNLKWL